MAAIDQYLKMLTRSGAQSLTFRSAQPVELTINGVSQALSSAPVSASKIISALKEILPQGFERAGAGTGRQYHYTGPHGQVTFDVQISDDSISARATLADKQEPLPSATAEDEPKTEALQKDMPDQMDALPQKREGALKIDRIFHQMLDIDASDLHLKSGNKPMVRLHGEIKHLEGWPPFSSDDLWEMLQPIMPARNIAEFEKTKDTDFAYAVGSRARMRANMFMDIAGVGAVFRQIPSEILTAAQLNLPEAVINLCKHSKGLILVTGPTGSGKSTTLAAMIDYINDNRNDHIITIEDPVEFVHPDKLCLINQREIGTSTMSFKSALRAALREDPDIVLVGELRDLETTEIAIETASTGHLVFGTLHTNTAASTIGRIIDQFPPDRQTQIQTMLAESLVGVISQTLCKKQGGGRVAALEILLVTSAVSNLIREGKTFQIPSVMQTSRNMGMQTLNDVLAALAKEGVISATEAYLRCVDKKGMEQMLTKLGLDAKST